MRLLFPQLLSSFEQGVSWPSRNPNSTPPSGKLRRAARRHGRQPVQGLRPGPAVRQVRLRQVRRRARRPDRRPRRAAASPTWWRSRARRRSATRSTRSSARWPTPTRRDRRADFNDDDKLGKGKEMVDRLTNLVAIFEKALDFSKNRAEGDDLLGDAYEYLMRHFATESGKSKGQFYTPAEVSRIMAQVIGIGDAQDQRRHHHLRPHLRLRLAAAQGRRRSRHHGHALRAGDGQRHRGLARMNMILHDYPTAEIWQDNTLSNPHFKRRRQPQDLRLRGRQSALLDKAGAAASTRQRPLRPLRALRHPARQERRLRLPAAHPRSLKSTGKGAVHPAARRAVPRQCRGRHPQRTSSARATSRASSACRPTCSTAPASRLHPGAGQGRRRTPARASSWSMPARASSRTATRTACAPRTSTRSWTSSPASSKSPSTRAWCRWPRSRRNDFNLNLPRYIDSTEPEDLQDIDAHLQGRHPRRDIDALAAYWEVFPQLRQTLFEADRPGYSQLAVEKAAIKAAIFGHPEFTAFIAG